MDVCITLFKVIFSLLRYCFLYFTVMNFCIASKEYILKKKRGEEVAEGGEACKIVDLLWVVGCNRKSCNVLPTLQ